jgi:hypothetical protein
MRPISCRIQLQSKHRRTGERHLNRIFQINLHNESLKLFHHYLINSVLYHIMSLLFMQMG